MNKLGNWSFRQQYYIQGPWHAN